MKKCHAMIRVSKEGESFDLDLLSVLKHVTDLTPDMDIKLDVYSHNGVEEMQHGFELDPPAEDEKQ